MEIETKYKIGDKLYVVNIYGEFKEIKIKAINILYSEEEIYIHYLDEVVNYIYNINENNINNNDYEKDVYGPYFFDETKKIEALELAKQIKEKYKERRIENLKKEYQKTLSNLKDIEKELEDITKEEK